MKTNFGAKHIVAIQEDFKKCGIWPQLWLQDVVGKIIKHVQFYLC
jgi:hypothetical protein